MPTGSSNVRVREQSGKHRRQLSAKGRHSLMASFDDIGGAGQERRRDVDAKRLRDLELDGKLDLRVLIERRRMTTDVIGCTLVQLRPPQGISPQMPGIGEF